MVVTASSYTDLRYRTNPGEGFDGVVRISYGGFYATGALLYNGRAVITAAHLFDGRQGTAAVAFETTSGLQSISASAIMKHPAYDGGSNNDLAIVWLSQPAPVKANRYDIYRQQDEIGQTFKLAGYGMMGVGDTGAAVENYSSLRLMASNSFDVEGSILKYLLGSAMGWSPAIGTQLIADFDNGSSANDALGRLIFRNELGKGLNEGFLGAGDSGGGAFLDGKIAGVASYTANLNYGYVAPDIDARSNSSFGEIAAWQRVSAYQKWIDQSLRAAYLNAPAKPAEVQKQVAEGNLSTSTVYFLLSFTGVRLDPNQILSVDYATRAGTAAAGVDFIAVSGTLNLYPDEIQAAIPVEIIGDLLPEPNETFYLDIFNPVGGSFGEGVVKITAVRTILDDDGWFG
jgi:hypothetical protein